MKLFQVDTLAEARDKVKNALSGILRTTQLMPEEALGMTLSQDVRACLDVPGFNRSTVDGYAVRASDTAGAGESMPTFLEVTGEISMGTNAVCAISAGQCAYVPTGGMLPPGSDAVVMVEYCENFDQNHVAVYNAVSRGRNIVVRGEDIRTDEVFLKAGTVIGPCEIGAMAAAGVTQAEFYMPPRISVISTGDELVQPGSPLLPGQIYDINTPALSALAKRYGMQVVSQQVVRDEESLLRAAVRNAMETSDIVCISGGSSQGRKDMTMSIIDSLARPGVFTHGLALKPGKPTILGLDETTGTFLAGLPGHPVAAMMVFQLIVAETWNALMGQPAGIRIPARMACNIGCDAGKANCIPVQLFSDETGYIAQPVRGKSGLITTLSRAQGYVLTDHNAEGLKEGEIVSVCLF